MSSNTLLLICTEADAGAARALANAVTSDWIGGTAPAVTPLTPAQLTDAADALAAADAAWIYAGHAMSDLAVQQSIITLRQSRLAVMLSRLGSDEPAGVCWQDGVMIGPAEAPVAQLRLILQALASQGANVRDLAHEVLLHQRSRHGLVDQIDKLDEELRLAARIQREFLPSELPIVHGIRYDVLYRPAGYVSGDTYDVQQLDHETVAFYVADAVGHGVPAALLTMLIKQSIRTRERRAGRHHVMPPADVLARLNADLIRRQSTRVQFVTACYAVMNCRTRRLSIARAGHPSPIVLRADGQTVNLEPDGPLLGVFEEPKFETHTVTLGRGDRLLMYSDGFELAFGSRTEVVDVRYLDELHALRHGAPDDALRLLEEKLDAAAGSLHQRDDLTALLMDVSAMPIEPASVADDRRRAAADPVPAKTP